MNDCITIYGMKLHRRDAETQRAQRKQLEKNDSL